ncbi:hypothetical protein LTR78_004336 [Recurvomyces mirabilis]|uniref:FAS1 domain-containing protein n=1 Tax=Recurvomyces mirabilis TaxID=574656 RepID=A0AAE0WPW0_9PEZI|nr:hypothetical protein LTR78_004336 [Recurvomyces mirabilis]KAK5155999.1 hypothetical protein LTS14_005565 [Recurvomyces mirabilis]
MRSYTLATTVVASAILLGTTQAQLLPFFAKPSPSVQANHNQQQQPLVRPGIQMPQDDSPVKEPPPPQGDIILSDVLGTQRTINIFAGFTRDITTLSTRLDTSLLNTTVLAPSNSAIQNLPRKPWESPADYDKIGAKAYGGNDGSARAQENLKKFCEAHIVPQSPWKEGEKVKTLAGDEVWWESTGPGGKAVVMPGKVEVEKVVSRVANGEVWMLGSVLNYAQ